jgi:hypothetical protein
MYCYIPKDVWVKRGNSRGEIPEGSTVGDIREISSEKICGAYRNLYSLV